jgi:hypothetical protein
LLPPTGWSVQRARDPKPAFACRVQSSINSLLLRIILTIYYCNIINILQHTPHRAAGCSLLPAVVVIESVRMVRLYLLLLFVPLLQAQQTVTIQTSSEGAGQPALVWVPTGIQGAVPLIVHLHSWSSHFNSSEAWQIALKEAQKRNWAFVSPEFRGPNERPEACASPVARQDILDSVDYMKQKYLIDPKRVYLLGGSGGKAANGICATGE